LSCRAIRLSTNRYGLKVLFNHPKARRNPRLFYLY
jgi:hypothetical protein